MWLLKSTFKIAVDAPLAVVRERLRECLQAERSWWPGEVVFTGTVTETTFHLIRIVARLERGPSLAVTGVLTHVASDRTRAAVVISVPSIITWVVIGWTCLWSAVLIWLLSFSPGERPAMPLLLLIVSIVGPWALLVYALFRDRPRIRATLLSALTGDRSRSR